MALRGSPHEDASFGSKIGWRETGTDEGAQDGNLLRSRVDARPAGDQLGLFVQSRVGDVRDVSQRLERGASRFLVPQLDREKLNVVAAGQLRLAA